MTLITLSIPSDEVDFISILAKKMGWKIESRDGLLERFINSCPESCDLTDKEIQDEVKAVRSTK